MRLLKRNILNEKTEKVDSYDAFDEFRMNSSGSLEQDWGIRCYKEFEDAFKSDSELEICYGVFTFTNV